MSISGQQQTDDDDDEYKIYLFTFKQLAKKLIDASRYKKVGLFLAQ